jgi:hypothetical protein
MIPAWSSKFELKPGTWVFVPTEATVQTGRELKLELEQKWHAPEFFFHLRAGGHVKALQAHLGNSSFARLDIKNFFGSINKTRVTRCLKSIFSYSRAREMANISTVLHPVEKNQILPFGFVQSPILASLCLHQSALGQFLQKLSKRKDVVVSVYVDDIILSSNSEHELTVALAEIKHRAARSGFVLNPDKESPPASHVTAFNIELSNASMTIEPRRWAQFVASFREADNENVRLGIHTYVASVNPVHSTQLDLA